MPLPEKPFFTLLQLSECWGVPIEDIGSYALTGMLTLSVVVVREVMVAPRGREGGKQARRRCLPPGIIPVVGFDVWPAFKGEAVTLTRFQSDSAQTVLCIQSEDQYQTIRMSDIVVRSDEKRRFEALVSSSTVDSIGENPAFIPSRRGPPTIHDWEGMWFGNFKTIYNLGIPDSQAELVRLSLDWFAINTDRVPDERQVKNKVGRFWRVFHSA